MRFSRNIYWHLVGLMFMVALAIPCGATLVNASMGEDLTSDIEPGDIYVMIGQQPVWMGNRIRYTVYETSIVEARFMTASGEIIILLPLGEQAPGQYTLPWHKTPEAAQMAGNYRFELYFGDEFAAKLDLIVLPAMNPAA